MKFTVAFYKKADGTEPAAAFLDGLDVKMRAKMLAASMSEGKTTHIGVNAKT